MLIKFALLQQTSTFSDSAWFFTNQSQQRRACHEILKDPDSKMPSNFLWYLHILYVVLNFISRGVNMMTVPKEAPNILWEMENVALSCGFFTGRWGDNGRLETTPFADTDTARLPWKARVWWGTTLGWNLLLCLEEPWGKLIRVFWHPNCIGGRQNPFMLWYSQLFPLRKPEEKEFKLLSAQLLSYQDFGHWC